MQIKKNLISNKIIIIIFLIIESLYSLHLLGEIKMRAVAICCQQLVYLAARSFSVCKLNRLKKTDFKIVFVMLSICCSYDWKKKKLKNKFFSCIIHFFYFYIAIVEIIKKKMRKNIEMKKEYFFRI